MFTIEFDHLDWHFTVLQWMLTNFKISQFSRFLLRSEHAIQVKFENDENFLILVPFIKTTLLNHLYIWILLFRLTFTALQWKKTNFRISKFSRFLLSSKYPIQFKIWKRLKFLNSVPFIKKTLVNEVYIRTWSFLMTFTILQWMKKTPKLVNFQVFC